MVGPLSSNAPRPNNFPSLIWGWNGSKAHFLRSPAGTTSKCPKIAKISAPVPYSTYP